MQEYEDVIGIDDSLAEARKAIDDFRQYLNRIESRVGAHREVVTIMTVTRKISEGHRILEAWIDYYLTKGPPPESPDIPQV